MAKAVFWHKTDAHVRKLGKRTGLDTPVVLAVNDGHWVWGKQFLRAVVNALNVPPGDYGRKAETQRN